MSSKEGSLFPGAAAEAEQGPCGRLTRTQSVKTEDDAFTACMAIKQAKACIIYLQSNCNDSQRAKHECIYHTSEAFADCLCLERASSHDSVVEPIIFYFCCMGNVSGMARKEKQQQQQRCNGRNHIAGSSCAGLLDWCFHLAVKSL